jgi:hypothetical protein
LLVFLLVKNSDLPLNETECDFRRDMCIEIEPHDQIFWYDLCPL